MIEENKLIAKSRKTTLLNVIAGIIPYKGSIWSRR